MPTTVYKCNICGDEFSEIKLAVECEDRPVVNPYNIKLGDIVVMMNDAEYGEMGMVENVTILHRSHRVKANIRFMTGEKKGYYSDFIEINEKSCIPFINAMIPEIAEKLGAAVHNLWMAKRKTEKGWHAPEDCQENNFREGALCYKCCFWLGESINEFKCTKSIMGYKEFVKSDGKCPSFSIKMCTNCHSCMRPYAELPDSEKELDRAYPAEFFKILDEMGYMVTVKRRK